MSVRIYVDMPNTIGDNIAKLYAVAEMKDGTKAISGGDITVWAEEQTVKEKTGWIPVTERLPDKDGEYLVTKKLRHFGKTEIDIACWFKGLVKYDANNGFYKSEQVIAWMPLPKAYKEVPIENTEKVINKETEGTDL